MNRYPEQIPQALTTAFNGLGLTYAWRRRGVRLRSELTRIFLATNRDFCRRVCRCDWAGAEAVYTFNAAGLEILEQARRRGLRTVCEQTIAPYAFEQRILAEERALHPAWETVDQDQRPGSISIASGPNGNWRTSSCAARSSCARRSAAVRRSRRAVPSRSLWRGRGGNALTPGPSPASGEGRQSLTSDPSPSGTMYPWSRARGAVNHCGS